MEVFEVDNKKIEYTLERKKIKNCYISVKDGKVSVRVPLKTSLEKIQEMLLKRADWILKNIEKQKEKENSEKQYIDGEVFKVLGKDVILKVSYENLAKPKLRFWLGKWLVTLPKEGKKEENIQIRKLVEQFYQELADKEIEKAMRKMTMKVGLAPNCYKVKRLKSTWGNCCTTGTISINQNVVKYSRHAIEYVCLHEICHLQYMNHSKEFWNMVTKYMPDYKEAEAELKGEKD